MDSYERRFKRTCRKGKKRDVVKEDLDKLTPEELADLKVETEELKMKIKELIAECEESSNV